MLTLHTLLAVDQLTIIVIIVSIGTIPQFQVTPFGHLATPIPELF